MTLPDPASPPTVPIKMTGRVLRCDWPTKMPTLPGIEVLAERDGAGRWTVTRKGKLIAEIDATWATTRVIPAPVVIRERPGWATVLGILGLFCFLIGIVFFFVQTDRQVPGAVIEVTGADGRVFALGVRDDPMRLRYGIGASA